MLVDGSVYDWKQSSLLTLQLSTGFILQGLEYTAHIMCLVGGWTSDLTSLLTVYPSNWRHAICSAMDESLFALLRTIVPRKLNTLKKKEKKHSFFFQDSYMNLGREVDGSESNFLDLMDFPYTKSIGILCCCHHVPINTNPWRIHGRIVCVPTNFP